MERFEGELRGPPGTPYEGGIFRFAMTIPQDWPYFGPRVQLLTRMFSAGVSESGENPWNLRWHDPTWRDTGGGTLWPAAYQLIHVLIEYEVMLGGEVGWEGEFAANVEPCHVMDSRRAELWREDPDEYKRLAREWTRRYATEEQVDALPIRR